MQVETSRHLVTDQTEDWTNPQMYKNGDITAWCPFDDDKLCTPVIFEKQIGPQDKPLERVAHYIRRNALNVVPTNHCTTCLNNLFQAILQ